VTDQFFDGNCAIAEAQKCRQMLLEQTGSKSTWCIVTRKSFWPRSYFFPGDEDLIRQRLNQGHEVQLVFAAGRRSVLADCTSHQAVDLATADELLRRFARKAMKQAAWLRLSGRSLTRRGVNGTSAPSS